MALEKHDDELDERPSSVNPCHVQEVLRNTDSEQSESEGEEHEEGGSDDNDDEQEQPTITPTPEQLAAARFTNWYKQHKHHTIPSRIIPLTQAHVNYLLSDSIHIPGTLLKHSYTGSEVDEYEEDQKDWQQQVEARPDHPQTQSLSDTESDNEEQGEEEEFFPELVQDINNAIAELGGAVFPRIDLTNPSDAVWITVERTLKCNTAGDVLLLMKASTSVAEELHQQQQDETPTEERKESPTAAAPCLVLRKYVDIHPGRKFRCFVKDNQLIAISQHDCAQHYQHLTDTQTKRQIRDALTTFFTSHLRNQHPVSDYIFDVYGTEQMRVRLITIKPWSSDVSSLLFTWRELVEYDTRNEYPAELRVVGVHDSNAYHNVSLRDTAKKIMHRLPHMDNIDLSDADAIDRFAEACRLGKLT